MNETAVKQRLVILTGMSGAGKTVSLHALEDAGFYCMDNMPLELLIPAHDRGFENVITRYPRIAMGMDARNSAQASAHLAELFNTLKNKYPYTELIFLDADDDILLRRYSETRRRHPLSSTAISLSQAIAQERQLLAPLAGLVDLRINTSRMQLHALREVVFQRVAKRESAQCSLMLMSFGYKSGLPLEADFIFDVRCMPNPHWQPELRALTGQHAAVQMYLAAAPAVAEMLSELQTIIEKWIPRFEHDYRAYLTLAVGCTGGQHRSVYVVDKLAHYFRAAGREVLVQHRDMH